MRNRIAYALHKIGAYQALDECRDYAELVRSRGRKSFSQYGEDLFLQEHFRGRKGFYIDIGANHPVRGSNTYQLYRMGWEGLVVEPIKRLYVKHKRFRPRDIQVHAAAGRSSGDLTFYEIIPSVLSTCDPDIARSVLSEGVGLLLQEYPIQVTTVAELYRTYMAPRRISLLCIDTEGHDMDVLQGVDWTILFPEIVVCEANEKDKEIEIHQFLSGHGYSRLKSLGGSLVFGAS
jgi:FkbM family methyltransferase